MTYKKFLIQQQTYNGSQYTNVGSVIDTQVEFNVVCQEFPFKYLPETKDLPKRDWVDEHGEEVYIGSNGLKMSAYDVEAKFLYVGTEQNMAADLKRFISFLYGRNTGGAPYLSIYDEYTEIGRRGVYVQNVDDELYFFNDTSVEAIAQLKVKFRVTDPVTDIVLNYE